MKTFYTFALDERNALMHLYGGHFVETRELADKLKPIYEKSLNQHTELGSWQIRHYKLYIFEMKEESLGDTKTQ